MASPRPPPRLTGNDKTDLHSLFQWMQGFYEDVVLTEEYTTQADVDSTVDPVDATAESAQLTANEALSDAADAQAAADAAQSTANTAVTNAATAQAAAVAAQSTADGANTTANTNKTILDAQESGEFTIANTDTTSVITLAATQADTSYYVTFGRAAISGSPAADSYIISGIVKTTTQFTVTLKAAPGAATDVTFAWHLTR